MTEAPSHVAYVDDSGDLAYPQGTDLGVLAALVYSVEEARSAERRLIALKESWAERLGKGAMSELHCPSWLRDWDHESGLARMDRHMLMGEFLQAVVEGGGRLVVTALDKRSGQPERVGGKPQVAAWHRHFENILATGRYVPGDRIEWRLDGPRHPHSGSGARLVRQTCRESCGVNPAVCSLPPQYVNSRDEVLIQAADAAAYFVYQSLLPAQSHLDLCLPYDVAVLNRLCSKGVLRDVHFVRLPAAQREATAL